MKQPFKLKPFYFLVALMVMGAQACKDENPNPDDQPVDETELITTAKLVITDSATGISNAFVFSDPDGEGGNNPVQFDSILLSANRTYTCKVILLDESKTPADSISNEVIEEAEDHLFVFQTTISGLRIQTTDKDNNNLPLGIRSLWRTTSAGSGTVQVKLKHQPGVKTGSPDPGETDLDIQFQCKIQ